MFAGVPVFERETHWIEAELNRIAERFAPQAPHSIELHGSPMRIGRDGWDQYAQAARHDAIVDALSTAVCKRHPRPVRLSAAALEKANFAGQDIAQVAFDSVAYAIYLKFERDDDRYYRHIASCFDAEGGLVHGLYTRQVF